MNRHEFLKQLEGALEAEMSPAKVKGHVEYYRSYIAEELKNGKSEKEVMDLLGDPWVIARSIIDSPLNETDSQYAYADYEESKKESSSGAQEMKRMEDRGSVCRDRIDPYACDFHDYGADQYAGACPGPGSCNLDRISHHTESQTVREDGKKRLEVV